MESISARNQDELVEKLKQIDVEVGGRFGPNRRTSEDCELYIFKNLIENYQDDLNFPWPVTINHEDAPDFIIKSASTEIGIEITEAAPPEDGRALAMWEQLSNNSDRVIFDSELPYRHSGGPKSDVSFTISDIQDAINRKFDKPYVKDRLTELWIYPNSNASTWLTSAYSDDNE